MWYPAVTSGAQDLQILRGETQNQEFQFTEKSALEIALGDEGLLTPLLDRCEGLNAFSGGEKWGCDQKPGFKETKFDD